MRVSKSSLVGTILVILLSGLAACSPAAATAVVPVTGRNVTPAGGVTPTLAAEALNSSGGSNGGSTLNVGTNPKLGNILVGPTGMTLYEFLGDTNGASNCTVACIETWPPLEVPGGLSPALGSGVSGDLSTIVRPDGSSQVTLNGAPLYYFTGDRQPGEANGQGYGGKWFAVAPDGSLIRTLSSPTPFAAGTGTPTPSPTGPTATATPAIPAGSSTAPIPTPTP